MDVDDIKVITSKNDILTLLRILSKPVISDCIILRGKIS